MKRNKNNILPILQRTIKRKNIIKVFIFIELFILLPGCAQVYTYELVSSTAFTPKKNELVFIVPNSKGVVATKTKPFVEEYLTQNNLKITKDVKKAKYVAFFSIDAKSWQTQRTIPVWGKTGISSIDTTSYGSSHTNLYGSYNSYTNYGLGGANTYGRFNGVANTSSISNSHSTVNYDYGITGYHNVIDNHFIRNFSVALFDVKTKSAVYETSVTTSDYCEETEFMEFVKYIYMQNPQIDDIKASYYCIPSKGIVCEKVIENEGPASQSDANILWGGLFGGLAGLAVASNSY